MPRHDFGTPHHRSGRPSGRRHREVAPHILALLDRAQHGDRDAFAELYLTFREPITRYVTVRMQGRDRDAIPDLVQETFTGALADLPAALLDIRGWFITHAAKACNRHDWSRRRYVRAAYAARDHDPVPAVVDTGETPARLGRITFAHAMARLTAAQRHAIQLRYLDGYPRDAAARLMNRTAEAVRCLERRGLRHLQAAPHGSADPGMNAVQKPAKGPIMTLFYIAVYHNTDSRFFPYEPGHALMKVISHWRHLPAETTPEDIADWAYHLFNADLDQLQGSRGEADGGEMDFLLACAYRLLGLRSLSAGDVISITTESTSTWLACEFDGWRRINAPEHRTGHGLIAATVYHHLSRGNHA